ncbi:hypothetical protein ABBQ38_002878 [Trebouxia sp. C0009 RCD-2024]
MAKSSQQDHATSLIRSLCNSASAAAVAEGLTLPLDTAKVRLQLQNFSHHPVPRYKGPLQTVGRIIKDEGLTAPFKGFVPGLHRQLLFTGLRLGLYDAVKTSLATDGELSVPKKIVAALCTSAIGITFANPADLVKVRLQACEHPKGLFFKAGHGAAVAELDLKPVYKSATDAYVRIVKEEGIRGLYKGYTANLLRNSIISATELVSYDSAKLAILHAGFADGLPVHLVSGLTAGLAATVLGSPWDVIGTRLMAPGKSSGKDAAKQVTGLFPFIADMLKTEGIGAFYKGFVPNFARIGSFNIVLWLSYEQIKKL